MHNVTATDAPPIISITEARASHPRILYLGDVPVESTYHGSALLFRLLDGLTPDNLLVVEGNLWQSKPASRLTNVCYTSLYVGSKRLLATRLNAAYSSWLAFRSVARAKRVKDVIGSFVPECVLTVAHGHLWLTAADFARRHQLPLHLIVHDDWPNMRVMSPVFKADLARRFAAVYQMATSRLCVSRYMADEYMRRYGVPGIVLHPSRAKPTGPNVAPLDSVQRTCREPTFAFAGTIDGNAGYIKILGALAEALALHSGKLLLFGPTTAEQAFDAGLRQQNVEICGMVQSAELVKRLRQRADALIVPMSFDHHERAIMEFGFPSKLADYTSVGIPILICGPTYCSAVRWAKENSGVAEIVDSNDCAALARAVNRIVTDAEYRSALAATALQIGARCFSHSAVQRAFLSAISG